MPCFSIKAHLLKDLEAVTKSRTINAYLVTWLKMDEIRIWMQQGESKMIILFTKESFWFSQSDLVFQKHSYEQKH